MIYNYYDDYLTDYITDEREQRAIAYVDTLGVTDTQTYERLVVLKTYTITAKEAMVQDSDVFKLKADLYQKEFDALLLTYREKEAAAQGKSLFTLGLQRG